LIVGGWLLFFSYEWRYTLSGMDFPDKLLASFFMSVSPRTAGFNTVNRNLMSESSQLLTIILMFIGGSSGSTAGGIKVTTLAVLMLSALNSSFRNRGVFVFKRKISDVTVRQAIAFFMFYLSVVTIATLFLSAIEPFHLDQLLFEVVSAIGTVGLSLGVTADLTTASKLVITALMFIGRVGWLTLLFSLLGKHVEPPVDRVPEKILIG
jgi:trk system potassium uptake protein TrkH